MRMRTPRLALAVLAFSAALAPRAAGAAGPDGATDDVKVAIPFTKTTLANGLTVILHEDHTLPMVAVNSLVRVGSHFEEAGRTGFAHLFEHLMFMGTARAPTKMFDAWMEAEGGSNNAWTSEDRTDYYDIGPSRTLPLLVWLEADRFSSLGKEMTQEKLDAQRDVVRNERRQTSENTPYGKVELRLPELMYPEGHPYHHPVIGSHEDLQAATVDDVKGFFGHWYVPNNASLAVAGDFDPAKLKPEIERLFGWMPRVEVPKEPVAPTPVLKGVVRETLTDEVKLPKIVMAWHSPKRYAPGDADLDLAGLILTDGKASRLYKALVYDHPIAQEVHAEQRSQDLSSVFAIEAIAQPGVTLDELEKTIDAELAKLTAAPPTPEEVRRAQNQFETSFVARLQSVPARATLLNAYQQSTGDPGYAEKDLARYRAATPASVQAMAKQVLDPNARVILRRGPEGGARPRTRPPEGRRREEGRQVMRARRGDGGARARGAARRLRGGGAAAGDAAPAAPSHRRAHRAGRRPPGRQARAPARAAVHAPRAGDVQDRERHHGLAPRAPHPAAGGGQPVGPLRRRRGSGRQGGAGPHHRRHARRGSGGAGRGGAVDRRQRSRRLPDDRRGRRRELGLVHGAEEKLQAHARNFQ